LIQAAAASKQGRHVDWRMTKGLPCMCGWMKRGRAIKVPR
jgi:hypothetical protein